MGKKRNASRRNREAYALWQHIRQMEAALAEREAFLASHYRPEDGDQSLRRVADEIEETIDGIERCRKNRFRDLAMVASIGILTVSVIWMIHG